MEAEGRLTVSVLLSLPASARPGLLLQPRPKKGKPEGAARYVELEPAGQDRWRAVVEAAPALEEGHWDAYVMGVPGEERTPLTPGLRDLRALVSGGRDDRATPVAVRIPYATKDGRLAVRTWWRAMHAEAGPIVLTDDSMTVTARLFGARLGEDATATLRRRGQGSAVRQVALRAEDGQDFSFTVDYADLVAEGGGRQAREAPEFWDVYVHPAAGAPRIRVGRLLDDIAERKAVFVYPAALLDGVSVRPYYTVDNDLSVEVAPRRTG